MRKKKRMKCFSCQYNAELDGQNCQYCDYAHKLWEKKRKIWIKAKIG